jgi:hypothetical protein
VRGLAGGCGRDDPPAERLAYGTLRLAQTNA